MVIAFDMRPWTWGKDHPPSEPSEYPGKIDMFEESERTGP